MSIVDAEEMEYPKISSEGGGGGDAAILQKIELHQKVFPQHKVVGWYRVQKQDENSMNDDGDGLVPSEEDLRMNQTEMARYCRGSNNPGNGGSGEDEEVESPLFVLMNASKTGDGGNKKPSSGANNASEEMEVDEELPLMVYETLPASDAGGGGAVFVNADFELETYEPERIAVEKVFKTQPSKSAVQSAAATAKESAVAGKEKGDSRKAGKKSKKDEAGDSRQRKPAFTRGPSELDSQVDSLRSSVHAMNLRVSVLLEFLRKVERGEIKDPDDALLRSVDGLVRQLPLVLAALEEGRATSPSSSGAGSPGRTPLRELELERDNAMLLTYLAAVAKTTMSVHVYSEKFRNACESGKSDPRRPLY